VSAAIGPAWPASDRSAAWVVPPLAAACALVALVLFRFGGRWTENDTMVLGEAARGVLAQHTITPTTAYDHGFAFPTLVATLAGVTDLPVATVQMVLLPWYTVVTTLVAFVAFRAVTGSGRAGALGALLLLIQSDFLFVNQRGSHEKATWTLVLAMIALLALSYRADRAGQAAPLVVAFYLCGFALLCTNAFFGSSLTMVIALAGAGSAVVGRRLLAFDLGRRVAPRFGYACLILGILVYLVMAVLYPPARSSLGTGARTADRLASLYLNVETGVESQVSTAANVRSSATVSRSRTTTSPYRAVSIGWTSTRVFFALTTFTWLLIAVGAVCWLVLAAAFVRRRVSRDEVTVFVVWALAAAAAVQVVASVASDFAGVLGSNLQLRLFPFFAVFTVPVVVATLYRYPIPWGSRTLRRIVVLGAIAAVPALAAASPALGTVVAPLVLVGLLILGLWERSRAIRYAAVALGAAAYLMFAGAAFLKAMNDPLVGTNWTFYTAAEARALEWGNRRLVNQLVWSDYDERLQVASFMLNADDAVGRRTALWTRGNTFPGRYLLLSDTTLVRALRLRAVAPSPIGLDRVYDNGSVRIAHRVPATPYQP
jgi:hypothetical protein